MTGKVSVVIPALNEAAGIGATLAGLQGWRKRGHEVILVDGGSADATVSAARPWVDQCLQSAPGRARQMNAGAREAAGDILLFLHADTQPPEEGDKAIVGALEQSANAWGCFTIRLSGSRKPLRWVEAGINRRTDFTGIVTGDQGLFLPRTLFEDAGKFEPLPLMEDVALSKRLRRRSRPVRLPAAVISSSRRWEEKGILRTVLLMWWLRFAYFCGADPDKLVRLYYSSHSRVNKRMNKT